MFEAMRRGLVADSRAVRLLEAQIATGGLIDPRHNHRVPIRVAYQRGLFNEDMQRRLEDPTDDTKGFFDPNTQENLTYIDLIRRCQKEPETGFHYLVLREKRRGEGRASRQSLWESTQSSLDRSNSMTNLHEVGMKVSRNYNQSNASSRQEIKTPDVVVRSTSSNSQVVEDEKTGIKIKTTEEIVIEKRTRELSRKEILFTTSVGVVNLHDLAEANCIDHKSLVELEEGKLSLDDVRRLMDQYLNGFAPISGVHITHGAGKATEIVTLYEAELRGLINPSLSFFLLEAQTASGGLTNPNAGAKRYDLNAGFTQGLIGRETINELKNARCSLIGFVGKGRAVMSTLEALRHGMIAEDDVLRLLHIQVATGGIVNVHKSSHRLPLVVAHDRCMWQNDWMNHEPKIYHFKGVNYSYQELLKHACVPHPEHNFPLLKITGNMTKTPGIVEVMDIPLNYFHDAKLIPYKTFKAAAQGFLTEEDIENHLRRKLIGCEPISGIFIEGQKLSIWDAV